MAGGNRQFARCLYRPRTAPPQREALPSSSLIKSLCFILCSVVLLTFAPWQWMKQGYCKQEGDKVRFTIWHDDDRWLRIRVHRADKGGLEVARLDW